MLRTDAVPVLLVLALSAASFAAVAPAPDGTAMLERVRVLSDDALAGRGNGTPEALAAADTVRRWFREAGLVAPPGRPDMFEDFPLTGEGLVGRTGRNVLGWIPGRGALAGKVVVLGAHYDHLGRKLGPDGETVGIYHGAEDNASGVAVLVELARLLVADDAPDRCALLFAAFAGEEVGLQGSAALAHDPLVADADVRLMLNLDSVGRLRNGRLYVGGLGSSPRLRDLVTEVGAAHALNLELSDGGWDASDHVSFNVAGDPVLFLFTGAHPQYHTTEDRWELIEPDALVRVASFARDVAEKIATDPVDYPYSRQSELPRTETGRGAKRAWLGTIPDFVEQVEGVKLSGVMPDSPAEEAGLKAGDVLVDLAGTPVKSLRDLATALQDHGAGETVAVIVERDGEPRTFVVTLRERPR